MKPIVTLLALPVLLLNFLGGFIGGVWLLFEGDWRLVVFGLFYGFVGALGLSLVLLPGMIFALPAVKAAESGHPTLGALIGAPSMAWTLLVVTVSCVMVFSRINTIGEGGLPYLLWGYSVAVGPWTYMASKDPDHTPANGATLLATQLGAISMMVATVVDPLSTDFERLAWWFAPFPILAFVLVVALAVAEARAPRQWS